MNPNILFLSIDSLRSDRCFGDEKTTLTPNMDSLIQKGTYFSQMISTADQTGTSLTSLFIGIFPIKSGKTQFNFSSDITTYFDLLKQNGYFTSCFVPDHAFFQEFSSKFDDKTIYDFKKTESWLRLDGGLGEQIANQLKSNKMKSPWIYFVHLMDIRPPFPVPEGFEDEKFGKTNYDKLVSSLDVWIGNFLKEVNLENTLVIITSDHGEYIPVTGEHISEIPKVQNLIKKGTKSAPFLEKAGMKFLINLRFAAQTYRKETLKRTLSPFEMRSFNTRATLDLYDEIIRVPLIISGCGIDNHKIISDMTRHVDVFPTLFEILGFSNFSNIDGRSLLPLIKGEKLEEEPAYIEVGINLAQLIEKNKPNAQAKVIGIRTSSYKYYRYRDKPDEHVHLFDLKNDPLELENIADSNKDMVKKMEEILQNFMTDSNNTFDELTEEEIKNAKETLLKLGYI